MSRITLSDTLPDIFFKLSEGNVGAANVLAMIVKNGRGDRP